MGRTLMAALVATSLVGVAAAAEATDAADEATDQTTPTKAEDRGWFSRLNPFSPLIKPQGPEQTEPDTPAEGTVPETVAPTPVAPEASEAPKSEAEDRSTVPVLNGILFSRHLVIAIVSDAIAKTGDLVDGYRVTTITQDTVVAEKAGKRYIMTTRRPEAQLDVPPQPVPDKATDLTAPIPNHETPSSAASENADDTGAGSQGPDRGTSGQTRPALNEAEQTP